MDLQVPGAIAERMLAESAKRIADADDAEQRSAVAYGTGRMQDYWNRSGHEAEVRMEAEHERIERESNADGGDSGEPGGGESGNPVSADD